MSDTPKACKDCRWCNYRDHLPWASTCQSPKRPTKIHPVSGEQTPEYSTCEILRGWGGISEVDLQRFCGPDASWFEAKDLAVAAPPV